MPLSTQIFFPTVLQRSQPDSFPEQIPVTNHFQKYFQVKNITIRDVTPLSLGKSIIGDRMSVILKRNSKIPCKASRPYITTNDNQTAMDIKVSIDLKDLKIGSNLLVFCQDLRRREGDSERKQLAREIYTGRAPTTSCRRS